MLPSFEYRLDGWGVHMCLCTSVPMRTYAYVLQARVVDGTGGYFD